MYIRKTQTGKRKAGGHYYTYRLVETYRVGNKVIQRTLLNLGSDFSFPEEYFPALCSRIKEILHNQQSIFDKDPEIESMAQNIAAKVLISQQKNHTDNNDYKEVDVNSMEVSRPRSVGCEHVTLDALRQLGLEDNLEELGFTAPQRALAMGSIIARACHPSSELETYRWLREQSGLGELIDYDFEQVTLYKMYQVSDLLLKHKSSIEEHLFAQERDIFAFEETITLYDLTNTYFEGQAGSSKLAQYGHSKEKRSDCPLVTLGLVLDGSGFPQRSYVYKGNVSEPETLSEILNGLHQSGGGMPVFRKSTVVMDAGIATDANIQWLIENDYPYIVVSRQRHREFDDAEAVTVKEKGEYKVKVQKVFDKEREETLLYCHSTQKEKKERSINQQASKRFEEALLYLHEGLSKKRRLKKYDKVIEKIGRLRQQFSKASQSYKIEIQKDEKTGNATKIKWELKPSPGTIDTHPGVYCLRTSHSELDEKQLWKTYTMLTDLESVFRSLKSELGLRPIHHQLDDRIIGHLFITVLAYHLVHFIRCRLNQGGIHDCWNTLRNTLLPLCRVTMSMNCRNGEVVHIRKSTRPEAAQHVIFSLLGIADYPGSTQKTIIQTNQRCSDIRRMGQPPLN